MAKIRIADMLTLRTISFKIIPWKNLFVYGKMAEEKGLNFDQERKTMLFDEYKKASKRHMQACESLLKNLEEYSHKKRNHILQEVYYLTGYIFECIYKYAIFTLIDYNPRKPVEKLEQDDLSYRKHIRTHKFSVLRGELDKRIPGTIPFIKGDDGIEQEIKDLYREWDPKFRYESQQKLSEEKIKKFVEWGKKTREEILKNV
jgi:hypothetical protein